MGIHSLCSTQLIVFKNKVLKCVFLAFKKEIFIKKVITRKPQESYTQPQTNIYVTYIAKNRLPSFLNLFNNMFKIKASHLLPSSLYT